MDGKDAGRVAGSNQDPQEAWERVFISMFARTCTIGHVTGDVYLRVTNTTFPGTPVVAGYIGEGDKLQVWADNPAELAVCQTTIRRRRCEDCSLVCEAVAASSTQDATGQPVFLEPTLLAGHANFSWCVKLVSPV